MTYDFCTLRMDGLVEWTFKLFDPDGSGKMSADEFKEMCRLCIGDAAATPGTKQYAQTIGKSPQSSILALSKALAAWLRRPPPVDSAGLLKELDRSRDGEITLQEFRAAEKKGSGLLFAALMELQSTLQNNILGENFWKEATKTRTAVGMGRKPMEVYMKVRTERASKSAHLSFLGAHDVWLTCCCCVAPPPARVCPPPGGDLRAAGQGQQEKEGGGQELGQGTTRSQRARGRLSVRGGWGVGGGWKSDPPPTQGAPVNGGHPRRTRGACSNLQTAFPTCNSFSPGPHWQFVCPGATQAGLMTDKISAKSFSDEAANRPAPRSNSALMADFHRGRSTSMRGGSRIAHDPG